MILTSIDKNSATKTDRKAVFSSVFPLQKGKKGQAFFFLPDLGGSVFYARKFIPDFGPNQPVYGFRLDPSHDWSTSQHDLVSIAEKFADDLILSYLPEPYHLIGHSFAGILAFETARQLEEKGAKVGTLAILDAATPANYRNRSWVDWALYIPKLTAGLFHFAMYKLPQLSFKEIIGKLKARLTPKISQQSSSMTNMNLKATGFATMDLSAHPKVYQDLISHLYHAMTAYEPQSYDGDMMIFKSKIPGFLNVDIRYLGWREYAKGTLNIHTIPGNHLDMVRGDIQVAQITKILTNSVDKLAH